MSAGHSSRHSHRLSCSVPGCGASFDCETKRTKLPTSGHEAEQMMVQLYMVPISIGWKIRHGHAECPGHARRGPTSTKWELYARLCEAGWTQGAVARACGVSRSAISQAIKKTKGERA